MEEGIKNKNKNKTNKMLIELWPSDVPSIIALFVAWLQFVA